MAPQQKFGLIELLAVLLTVGGAFAVTFIIASMIVMPHPHPTPKRIPAMAHARGIVQFLAVQSTYADSLAEAIRTPDGDPAETTVDRFRVLARLGLDPRTMAHRGDTRQPWQGDTSPDFDPPITAENISFAMINHESAFWQRTWSEWPSTPILVDRNTSNDDSSPRSVWSEQQPWEGVIANSDASASFERTQLGVENARVARVTFPGNGTFNNFQLFSGARDGGAPVTEVRMRNP